MAVELRSENSGAIMSPRISFSHDFCPLEAIPVEQRPFRSNSRGFNSSIDFDFCVQVSFDEQSSSADELFSDGKILAIEMKKKTTESDLTQPTDHSFADPPLRLQPQSLEIAKRSTKDRALKASKSEAEEKPNTKSFWSFKRSSSCGSGYGRSFCPLPLLSRSYSTGSTPTANKRSPSSKDGHNLKYNVFRNSSTKSSHCSSYSSATPMSYQKPPLKKNHTSYATGTNVNRILNVRTGTMFGLSSIFSSSKDKTKKK